MMGYTSSSIVANCKLSLLSRKQMQSLSVDLEAKILHILDDKINGLTRMMVNDPELIKVVSKTESYFVPDLAFSYHVLYTLAHASHMLQREVVRDN